MLWSMGNSISQIGSWISRQFSKPQGKDYLSEPKPLDTSRITTRVMQGGGGGFLVGAGLGFIAAQNEISKVPVQTVTHDYRVPATQSEQLGLIPRDNYTPAIGWNRSYGLGWGQPSDRGVPTEPVYRDNPVYGHNGDPHMEMTSKTFSGHGRPVTTWHDRPIEHHTMNGYRHYAHPHTESVFDHTERWTEQEAYTVYESGTETYQDCVSSYNSDGSTGQDCHTAYRTVSIPKTEYRTVERSRDVYRDELRGWYETYSPNIASRTVGTYKEPKVTFDHGVNVGSFVAKGLLIGAGLGAIALGVMDVINQRAESTNTRPEPTPAPPGNTTPAPPKPNPPVPRPPVPQPPRAPDYGRVENHAHAGGRHTHAGGDRWHFHGCPDEVTNPLNTQVICFKPDQVPSGYQEEKKIDCAQNGTVCFNQKGEGSGKA